jgi:PAS domain S-box-containing protein
MGMRSNERAARGGTAREVREMLRLLRSAVERAHDAVVVTTAGLAPPEPAIVYVNPAFEAMSGYGAAEVIGKTPRILQGPRTDRAMLDALRRALAAGETFRAETFNYRKDGGEYLVDWTTSPVTGEGGAVTHWVAIQRDVTGRRREEEERRRAAAEQEKLRQAISRSALEWRFTFDAIASPLLLLEGDGRIVRMNEAARTLAGVTYEQAVQHPLAVLGASQPWPAVHTLLARAAAAYAGAGAAPANTAAQALDGQGRTWDVSVSPMTSPDGQRWFVVVARDITDLVKLQESLRRSETMSAMGALVAGVSHEVRNPLFGISATLDAFQARFQRRKEYRRYFEVLQGEVERMSVLMQELLDYGKPLQLNLALDCPRDVLAAAVAACSPLAEQAGVEIVADCAADLPAFSVDRNRLVRMFQNLLENAVQHSPVGGRVRVRAERLDGGAPPAVRFAVEDSGPGIRPDDLCRIFEPFFTRRRGGTGLGLSIVQRIVEQHGGEIAAANLPGGGAAMVVTLPLAPPPAPRGEAG